MYLKRIADLREDNDLTQKEIAKMLNVHRSTYSKWENGDNNIPLDKLDKLALKYNVSFDYIFNISDNKRADKAIYLPMKLETLRHNMRLSRKRMGFTQESLAKKLNVNKGTYCRYENGGLLLPIDKFSTLYDIFGYSLDALSGKVKLPKEKSKKDKFMKV